MHHVTRGAIGLLIGALLALPLACTQQTNGGDDPSIDEVAAFLETHVENESGEDGRLAFSNEDHDLSLTLDKVHRERLSKIEENRYFVCADFEGADGTMYDLDFWVDASGDDFAVTETTLHKIAGEPLYTWHEEDGVWVKHDEDGEEHPAGDEEHPADGAEHPEHGAEHPSNGAEHPSNGAEHPSNGAEHPSNGAEHPSD